MRDDVDQLTISELSPEADAARRVAFVLASVEAALGQCLRRDAPFTARVENALTAAMHSPTLVTPEQYAVLFEFLPKTEGNA